VKKPIFILEAGSHTVVGTRAKIMGAVKGGYLKFAQNKNRPASDVAEKFLFTMTVREPGTPHARFDSTQPFELKELERIDAHNCNVLVCGNA
jgi:hypothetical protein